MVLFLIGNTEWLYFAYSVWSGSVGRGQGWHAVCGRILREKKTRHRDQIGDDSPKQHLMKQQQEEGEDGGKTGLT